MKPSILVAMLAFLCSNRCPNARNDFGVYLLTDKATKKTIVVRAKYYVTSGIKDDSLSAAKGIQYWNKLSGKFLLVAMNEKMEITGDTIPICFELSLHMGKDPFKEQDSNTYKGLHNIPGWDIRNTFFIVDRIRNGLRDCWVKDLNGTLGLTCGNSFVRVLRSRKDDEIVLAHEIGHTLGLKDREEEGLMQQTWQGGREVFEYDIKAILDHSSKFRLNIYRNSFDTLVPKGKIIHYLKKDTSESSTEAVFLKPLPGSTTD